jgi:hypothetical protein
MILTSAVCYYPGEFATQEFAAPFRPCHRPPFAGIKAILLRLLRNRIRQWLGFFRRAKSCKEHTDLGSGVEAFKGAYYLFGLYEIC